MADGQSAQVSPGAGDRSIDTRERLILAAEKLFGEEGMGVSMRRINAEAQQKNVSAMHYHFGTRDALIQAIFDYRMTPSAVRREQLLAEIVAEGRDTDLRSVVKVAIWPLVEQILPTTADNHFVRFLSQAHRLPEFDSWTTVRHSTRQSLVRIYLRIMRLVTDLPRPVVHARAIMGLRRAIYFIADLDRVIEARHPELRDKMVDFYANDLVDMLTAELTAPLTPDTRSAYEALLRSGGADSAAMFGPDALQAVGRGRTAPRGG